MKNYKFSTTNQDFKIATDANHFGNHKFAHKRRENSGIISTDSLFDKDSAQNLSGWEAALRGILVVFMPFSCSIDWYYGTNTLFFIAPVIFYLEFTALTLTCPIKSLFFRNKCNGPSEL